MTSSQATLDVLVRIALEEDLSDRGDVTSNALVDENSVSSVDIVTRASGVLSGVDAAQATIAAVDSSIDVSWNKSNGNVLMPGDVIATLNGKQRSLLIAERTTLNFLQHLSGVATLTKRFVDEVASVKSSTIVRDTRKTLPGYRALEKTAVVHGGGQNHRMGLFDAFLVKDNHLAGRDLEIIAQRCRDFDPTLPLEIEVDSLEQLRVVVDFNPDVILIDNFDVSDVVQAIEIANGIPLEISGGVTLDTIGAYAQTGVAYIAVGALTHSAPALDIGFDVRGA